MDFNFFFAGSPLCSATPRLLWCALAAPLSCVSQLEAEPGNLYYTDTHTTASALCDLLFSRIFQFLTLLEKLNLSILISGNIWFCLIWLEHFMFYIRIFVD